MNPSFRTALSIVDRRLHAILQPRVLWLALLGLAFLASATLVATRPWRSSVTLWFPGSRGDEDRARPELRRVPRRGDDSDFARTVAEELLLGPADSLSRPLAPARSSVRTAIASGKTVYVDLSADVLFGRPDSDGVYGLPLVEPRRALTLIRDTIAWNMPGYRVVVTVAGQEAP